ncbi:hypothetical protein AMTR_s00065p00202730 [Amborella trichopoda]|uniref:Uncharacterized protein n=1 Tax=Amborella trichopoda TaxID=13333 RepID=U5CZA9_AMBTC|nr:hypothetical protein AMTR_s00065p00202730 [Amborella trichopoda]
MAELPLTISNSSADPSSTKKNPSGWPSSIPTLNDFFLDSVSGKYFKLSQQSSTLITELRA